MAVAYEQFNDDIEAHSVHSSDSESIDAIVTGEASRTYHGNDVTSREMRMHHVMNGRWPYESGCAQLVLGLILSFLGILEIITLPVIFNDEFQILTLCPSNLYGLGEWIGLLTIGSGMIGLGAAFRKSINQVYAYFAVILLQVCILTVVMLVMIIAASNHTTSLAAFHHNKPLYGIHVAISLVMCLIYLVVIGCFTQYYELVFFGELQCCKLMLHIACPCLCPRAIATRDLLEADETERPPSLPV